MLKCSDGSLYTGITNDFEKRMLAHQNGKGSKYVRSRLPFKMVYRENCETKSEALKREVAIKKLSKAEKNKLI